VIVVVTPLALPASIATPTSQGRPTCDSGQPPEAITASANGSFTAAVNNARTDGRERT
jgi:hypothetical protein